MKQTMKPTQQIYANYTPEDFKVWEILFKRQLQILENKVSGEYLKALATVGFNDHTIPDFEKTNAILRNMTGWQLVTVPNISPADAFFKYLSHKKFTATCWLRGLHQLDYLEEPDMFHDVFAHTPLLCNRDYSTFFENIGKLAVQHEGNSRVLEQLQRLYWFTIEFGLINEHDGLKVFGAGIISSKEETLHALGKTSRKTAFSIEKIIRHEFRTDILQNEYYVIDSFQQLTDSLKQVEAELEKTHERVDW